jgi:hypothetical protein
MITQKILARNVARITKNSYLCTHIKSNNPHLKEEKNYGLRNW